MSQLALAASFAKEPLQTRDINSSMSLRPSASEDVTSSGKSPTKPSSILRVPSLKFTAQAKTTQPACEAGIFPSGEAGNGPHSHYIVCPKSVALLLGRAKLAEKDASMESSAADAIGGSIPVQRASLPSTARHVSRDHAVLFHTPFCGSSWAVKIIGQNGLIVNGKRRRAGLTLKIVPGETTLDFFGVACLFKGDGIQNDGSVERANVSPRGHFNQDGRSPSKKTVTAEQSPASDASDKENAAIEETPSAAVIPPKRFIANMLKRPQGAPFSPPTSSPAPRDSSRTSSPLRVNRDGMQSLRESDDDDDDESESVRAASPTLARRSGKGNDGSAVLVPGGRESEDEASQALPAVSSGAAGKAGARDIVSLKKRELSGSGEEPLPHSPSGTPRRSAHQTRETKRVKFQQSSTTGQAGTTSRTSTAIPLETMQTIQAHYRSLVRTLASTYDVQGLLAGAIVFHRTATISATEAVRSVLSANPGLLRGEVGPEGEAPAARGEIVHGWTRDDLLARELVQAHEVDAERVDTWQRKAWREKLESCLIEGECFGIIQRAGKDASGNPLECWYYYDKEHDPDAQRAANLGAFAKPMRAALKSHKPIFWRKSAYGNNVDDAGAGSSLATAGTGAASLATTASGIARSSDQQSLATESQWGSAGNVLSSLVLTGRPSSSDKSARKDVMPPPSSSLPGTEQLAASSGSWEETQFEETESTWDKEGDMDFEASNATTRRAQGRKRK